MQKIVMRVRGSLGLKLASDESEKGSAVSDTVSSATARVEVSDTLKSNGLVCAAKALLNAPQTRAAKLAHSTATKRLHKAKAHLLIGFALFSHVNSNKSTMRLCQCKLVEGPPGNQPWLKSIYGRAGAGSTV